MKTFEEGSVQIRRAWAWFTAFSFAVLLIVSSGCSPQTPSKVPDAEIVTKGTSAMCLDAAKKVLGADAEIVKCGHLIGDSSLESVAVIELELPAKSTNNADGGTNVSRLVILRKVGSEWRIELDVSNQIRNPSGYIATEYINDSEGFYGYRAFIRDKRPDQTSGLSIELIDLDRKGRWEGSPVHISWNPAVGRFQQFAANEDPEGFRSEIKNPPHWKSPCTQSTAGCREPPTT